MSLLDRIRSSIARRRMARLAPTLDYQPVALQRRRFVTRLAAAVLGGIALLSFRTIGTAGPLAGWIPKQGESPNADPQPLGHTNSHADNGCHCDNHSNHAGKHVNVASEVGHYDQVHPHMDSHMNHAHGNTHTNQQSHTNTHTDGGHVNI